MTIQEQFRQDLHRKLEGMPVKEAVRDLIKGNPLLYSYDLAAQVIGIEENKLRCKTRKSR
jgi:hypothetical protein